MSCRPSEPRLPARQRGAALVVALLVFAVAAALMVGLQRDFTLQFQRGSNVFLGEQAWTYLMGAEDLAGVALGVDAIQDRARETPRDDLSEIWAQESTPYALEEGGWLMGSLSDLQGRFNLNNLVADPDGLGAGSDGDGSGGDGNGEQDNSDADGAEVGEAAAPQPTAPAPPTTGDNAFEGRFNVPQKQLIRLLLALEGVGLSERDAIALVEAITDFIDADSERRIAGAESETYRSAQPAYYPANRPLASVSELRAITGMTEPLYRALAPLVTVWPSSGGPLNILTAPPTVLATLNTPDNLTPLDPEDVEALVQRRTEGVIVSVDTLLADPLFAGRDLGELAPWLGESSDWFLLNARVEIAGREVRMYSVLERTEELTNSRFRSMGEL